MEILFMTACWPICGIVCMVACLRLGVGPGLNEDLTEHSAFSLACLLLWPLIVLRGALLAFIFITRHVFGRLSVSLAKLVSRGETT